MAVNLVSKYLVSNYKEIFPEDTVTIIEELKEEYQLTKILEVLDTFGDYWGSAEIETILNIEDKDALYEFLQEHGNISLEFYEKFVDLCDDYDEGAVKAYIECVGIDYLNEFEEAYYGFFNGHRGLVEEILGNDAEEIPSWLCIDYDATWNCTLRHDFIEKDGYYFRRI